MKLKDKDFDIDYNRFPEYSNPFVKEIKEISDEELFELCEHYIWHYYNNPSYKQVEHRWKMDRCFAEAWRRNKKYLYDNAYYLVVE